MKKFFVLFCCVVFVSGLAFGSAYLTGQYHAQNTAFSKIDGLRDGDKVRVDAISRNQRKTLFSHAVHDGRGRITVPSDPELVLADDYKILVEVTPQGADNPANVDFVIDRRTGLITASVSGLPESGSLALRMNGKYLQKEVSSDWNGTANLRHEARFNDKGHDVICVDLGGYRGAALSVCHSTAQRDNIQTVGISLPPLVQNITNNFLNDIASGIFGGSSGAQNHSQTLADNYVSGFMKMTAELGASTMKQTELDAMTKVDVPNALETLDKIHGADIKAHRDFSPYEPLCKAGTLSSNMTASRVRGTVATEMLNGQMMDLELARSDPKVAQGRLSRKRNQVATYRNFHCSASDNGGQNKNFCGKNVKPENINMDINAYETLIKPLTISVDPFDSELTDEEVNFTALVENLIVPESNIYAPPGVMMYETVLSAYQDVRSVAAMRGLVRNSILSYAGRKMGIKQEDDSIAPFAEAALKDMGMDKEDIIELIGKNPSYEAQMALVTQMQFENPDFYVDISTDPAKVAKAKAMMMAFKNLQTAEMRKSAERSALLSSVWLELRLRQQGKEYNAKAARLNAMAQ